MPRIPAEAEKDLEGMARAQRQTENAIKLRISEITGLLTLPPFSDDTRA
ncbi:hypothetical protein MF672_040740 [Actinomadura sp. ATCC 31491]|uniref:Uncharacterized protein n=1 Tax=Actinomadura luzonensis TaxID=2805427 RepID=A0ABT0G7J5_9ACTN|nr:hypothetical protein [Actinomadura luzonensis]MCK2220081.1 hypothetical protein [Actinomadura luzonensis]